MKPRPLTLTACILLGATVLTAFWLMRQGTPPDTKSNAAKHTDSAPAATPAIPTKPAESAAPTTTESAPANESKPPPAEAEVVVSLGTVTDLGRQAAGILPMLREIKELSSKDPATTTAADRVRLANLQREHATFLGSLPEIAAFQDNPPEYGTFFGSLAKEAANLTDAQAAAVAAYMRQRSESMVQQGMKTTDAPADPEAFEAWEEKRDAFIEETAEGLAEVMPPGSAAKAGLDDRFLEFLEMDFAKAQQQK